MIKLVVSDFDGTLLPFGDVRVSSSTKNRIRSLLDAGAIFAVSSGRTFGELAKFLPEFVDEIYFIACDGAYYVKGGKTLYERKIEREDLIRVTAGEGGAVLHGAFCNYCIGEIPAESMAFSPTRVSSVYEIKEKIYKITSYGKKLGVNAPRRVTYALGRRRKRDGTARQPICQQGHGTFGFTAAPYADEVRYGMPRR